MGTRQIKGGGEKATLLCDWKDVVISVLGSVRYFGCFRGAEGQKRETKTREEGTTDG